MNFPDAHHKRAPYVFDATKIDACACELHMVVPYTLYLKPGLSNPWRAIDVAVVFADQVGSACAEKPFGDVAADPQSGDRQRSERFDGGILSPAGAVRGPDHHRGHLKLSERPRLSAHPRHLFCRAGCGLEKGD